MGKADRIRNAVLIGLWAVWLLVFAGISVYHALWFPAGLGAGGGVVGLIVAGKIARGD